MAAKTTRADFEAVFPSLVQDLTENVQQYGIPTPALEWYQRVCSRPFLSAELKVPDD